MKLNDYSSLLSELRKGERQRVYILTGERGLGKHSVLSAAAETIKETAPDATILSVHPDAFSFSLWPMEEALRQSTPDAALPSHEMKDGSKLSGTIDSEYFGTVQRKKTYYYLFEPAPVL